MPDPNHKIRCFASVLLLALTGATLGACSGGDFGRTREDMRSDDMHRWLGAEVTGSLGLKSSQFQLTDEERQLRDLAYPIIEPPLSRPAWKSVFGDYKALPSPWQQKVVFARTMYGRTLIDGFFHRILDRVCLGALLLETGRMRNCAKANCAVPSHQAQRHAITTQTSCKFIGCGNRHSDKSGLFRNSCEQIQARRGLRDT